MCANGACSTHVEPPTDRKTPILRSIKAKKHWAGNTELLGKFEGALGKINKLLCTVVNESKERREAVIATLSRFSSEDDGKGWLTNEYPEGIPGALYRATHTHILDEELVCKAKQMLRKKMPAGQKQGIDRLLKEYDDLCAGARICPKCGKLIRNKESCLSRQSSCFSVLGAVVILPLCKISRGGTTSGASALGPKLGQPAYIHKISCGFVLKA
eukprot:g75992.t1